MGNIPRKVNLLKPFNVDGINVMQDNYFSNAFIVDLPLDSTPDHIWQSIFELKWKSSRHLWDRKTFIINDTLRLVTSPDEFEDKLNWIETVVTETNKTIEEYLEALHQDDERRIKQEVQKHTSWEERARVEIIKEILRRKSA